MRSDTATYTQYQLAHRKMDDHDWAICINAYNYTTVIVYKRESIGREKEGEKEIIQEMLMRVTLLAADAVQTIINEKLKVDVP